MQLKEKAMTNGARVKMRGQARRRLKERLKVALYMAHRENADRVEGGGYKPGRYRLGIDVYIAPGWDVMAEAAIDFIESRAPAAKAVGQNGAGSESLLKMRGQARRRERERLTRVLYLAHRENADHLEGGGYKPGGYKRDTDAHVPPGSWEAMAEAAIDFFEIEMGKLMEALVGDRNASAKGYRAACDRFAREAVGMLEIGRNGAGSESLRETRYGTISRAGELVRALLAEIANMEPRRDRT
jgi:hypothetical protein